MVLKKLRKELPKRPFPRRYKEEPFCPNKFFTGRDPVEPVLGKPRCLIDLNAESHVDEA